MAALPLGQRDMGGNIVGNGGSGQDGKRDKNVRCTIGVAGNQLDRPVIPTGRRIADCQRGIEIPAVGEHARRVCDCVAVYVKPLKTRPG